MADEGRIRVELAFLSGEDSAAAKKMTEDLKTIAESMRVFDTPDYRESIKQMGKLADALEQSAKRLSDIAKEEERGRTYQNLPHGEGAGSSRPKNPVGFTWDDDPRRDANEFREKAATEAKKQQEQERTRLTAESKEFQQGTVADYLNIPGPQAAFGVERIGRMLGRGRASTSGGESSDPSSTTDDSPSFLGGIDPNDPANLPPPVPRSDKGRGGLRDWISGRLPNREGIQDWIKSNYGMGAVTTSALTYFQNRLHEGQQDIQDTSLGYARDSSWLGQPHIGPFGFQMPFVGSPAAQEQWRQYRDTMRLRFQPGINRQQAQAITNAVAEAGFSGGEGSDLRMDLYAPLMRRYNVNPSAISPFTRGLRTGQASIQDLNNALGDMGEVARTARLNVNQYASSLEEATEATEAMGGSMLQGMETAKVFTTSTGLAPDVLSRLSQSPIVQGYLAARTGVPAQAQGTLGPGTRGRATRDAVRALYQSFLPSMQPHTEVFRGPNGEVLGKETSTASDQAVAMIAEQMGLKPDEVKTLLGTGPRQMTMENMHVALEDYTKRTLNYAVGGGRVRQDRRSWILRQAGDGAEFDSQGRVVRGGKVIYDRKEVRAMGTDWANKKTEGTVEGGTGLQEIRQYAQRMGIDTKSKEWRKAEKTGNVHDREQNLQRLIEDKVAKGKAKYEIVLNDEAARYFKLLAKDPRFHPKKGPRNRDAGENSGPHPLDALKAAASQIPGAAAGEAGRILEGSTGTVGAAAHAAGEVADWLF